MNLETQAMGNANGMPKWLRSRERPNELRYCTDAGFALQRFTPKYFYRFFPEPTDLKSSPDQPIASSRNLITSCMLLDVLHRLTKRKPARVGALVQWKASAVLKRILRVENEELTVRALKVLKSQVPYLGRKWRNGRCRCVPSCWMQTVLTRVSVNMKAITSIYLHLGLEFGETASGEEIFFDASAAAAYEEALRSEIHAYNTRWFASSAIETDESGYDIDAAIDDED